MSNSPPTLQTTFDALLQANYLFNTHWKNCPRAQSSVADACEECRDLETQAATLHMRYLAMLNGKV
jgi:hypothetical protein